MRACELQEFTAGSQRFLLLAQRCVLSLLAYFYSLVARSIRYGDSTLMRDSRLNRWVIGR